MAYVAGRRIRVDGVVKQVGDPIPDDFIRRLAAPQLNALLGQGHIRAEVLPSGAMAPPGQLQGAAPQVPQVPQLTEAQAAALDALDDELEPGEEPEEAAAASSSGVEVDPLVGEAAPAPAAPSGRKRRER
jgi:hypothetical protein